jgi:hypothetical protein
MTSIKTDCSYMRRQTCQYGVNVDHTKHLRLGWKYIWQIGLDLEITFLGLALFFISFFIYIFFRMYLPPEVDWQLFVIALMFIGLIVTFIGMLVTVDRSKYKPAYCWMAFLPLRSF